MIFWWRIALFSDAFIGVGGSIVMVYLFKDFICKHSPSSFSMQDKMCWVVCSISNFSKNVHKFCWRCVRASVSGHVSMWWAFSLCVEHQGHNGDAIRFCENRKLFLGIHRWISFTVVARVWGRIGLRYEPRPFKSTWCSFSSVSLCFFRNVFD